MTPPTAERVAETVALIAKTLASGVEVGEGRPVHQGGTWHKQSLTDAYRWLHGAAYSNRAGGESTATLCSECNGYGWVQREVPNTNPDGPPCFVRERCEDCTPRYVSDRTGDAVITNEDLRKVLEKAGKALEQSLKFARDAVSGIQAAVGVIDQGVSRELPHERSIPRTATRAEVDEARAAQGRRVERGEGIA